MKSLVVVACLLGGRSWSHRGPGAALSAAVLRKRLAPVAHAERGGDGEAGPLADSATRHGSLPGRYQSTTLPRQHGLAPTVSSVSRHASHALLGGWQGEPAHVAQPGNQTKGAMSPRPPRPLSHCPPPPSRPLDNRDLRASACHRHQPAPLGRWGATAAAVPPSPIDTSMGTPRLPLHPPGQTPPLPARPPAHPPMGGHPSAVSRRWQLDQPVAVGRRRRVLPAPPPINRFPQRVQQQARRGRGG